jgi:hypothetical protein
LIFLIRLLSQSSHAFDARNYTPSTDQQEDYDNLTTMPIKYHTVGFTSGRCRSYQELSEIGTPCHLTKPTWTHLKLLKLQSVSNKPPRLLLSFSLFLTYPDARLPLMHSTYLNHCMIFEATKEAVNRQKQKQCNLFSSRYCFYILIFLT